MSMLSKVGREKGCTDARSSGTSTLSSSLLMRWTPNEIFDKKIFNKCLWKSQGTSKARLVARTVPTNKLTSINRLVLLQGR